MAEKQYSNYQKQVIKDYYRNLDKIALTRLQEMVTDLYLSESGKKTERIWHRIEKAMKDIRISPEIIKHIMDKRDAVILAKNLQDWLKDAK